MGSVVPARCRRCGTEFEARAGGGFRYAERYCSRCGTYRAIRYEEFPEVWEAFLALNQARQQERVPLRRHPIAQAEERLEQALQAAVGSCSCGSAFTEGRPRCPGCGAEDYKTTGGVTVVYD